MQSIYIILLTSFVLLIASRSLAQSLPDLTYQITLFERNEGNQIIAEADVDVESKTITSIGFFKIEYTDGTIDGQTEFDKNIQSSFEDLYNKLNIP